eukprot:UN26577
MMIKMSFSTVQDLCFYLENRNLSRSNFLLECGDRNIRAVSQHDQKYVIQFVEGDIDKFPEQFIDKSKLTMNKLPQRPKKMRKMERNSKKLEQHPEANPVDFSDKK